MKQITIHVDVTTLAEAIFVLGGRPQAGRVCNVSRQVVAGWVERGQLPRTETTGKTEYAKKMAQANPRIDAEALIAAIDSVDEAA